MLRDLISNVTFTWFNKQDRQKVEINNSSNVLV